MPSILIVDCFDSFTYNLYHYLDELNEGNVTVLRYDEFTFDGAKNFSHLVLSPGPGLPLNYPKILDYLKAIPNNQTILGVCLGHQCLGVAFGLKLKQLDQVVHGQTMTIKPSVPSCLFDGIEKNLVTGHYHSWVLDTDSITNAALTITSRSGSGLIMSIEHKTHPFYGVQFHPESIMTSEGKKVLKNWLMNSRH